MANTVEKNVPEMARLAITPMFAGRTENEKFSFIGKTFIVRAIDKRSGREAEFATSKFLLYKDRTVVPLANKGIVVGSEGEDGDWDLSFVFPCVPLKRQLSKALYNEAWATMPELTPVYGFIPITALFQFRINEDGTDIVANVNTKLVNAVSYFVALYADKFLDHAGTQIVGNDVQTRLNVCKNSMPIRSFSPQMLSVVKAQDAAPIINDVIKNNGNGKLFLMEEAFPPLVEISEEAMNDYSIKEYSIRQEFTCLPYGFFELGNNGMSKKRAILAEEEFELYQVGNGTVKICQVEGTESSIRLCVEGHFSPYDGNPFELGFSANIYQTGCDGYDVCDFYKEGNTDLGIIGQALFSPEVNGFAYFNENALLIDVTRTLYCQNYEAIEKRPEIFNAFIANTIKLLDKKVFPSVYEGNVNPFIYSRKSDIIIAYLGCTQTEKEFNSESEEKACIELCETDKKWLRVFKNCRYTVIDSDIIGSNLSENNFVAAASLLSHFSPSLLEKTATNIVENRNRKIEKLLESQTVQSRATICVQVRKSSGKAVYENSDTVFVEYLACVSHKSTGGELLFRAENKDVPTLPSVDLLPQIPLKDGSYASIDKFFEACTSQKKGLVISECSSIAKNSDYIIDLIPTRAGVYVPTTPYSVKQKDLPISEVFAILRNNEGEWCKPYIYTYFRDESVIAPM